MNERGAVAAGHPLTAEAGAAILRQGGNAVDAAVAAVLTSFVAESPLTGLGAGGFMLVHAPDENVLLDFFVAVPGKDGIERRSELDPVPVYFSEDVPQIFNVGAASCGVPGTAAGLWEALQPVRLDADGGAGSIRGRSRARGRDGERRAGVHLQDPRADPHPPSRGTSDLRAAGPAAPRGRRVPLRGALGGAGAIRGRGPRAVLPGRAGASGLGVGGGARRDPGSRGPGHLRADRPRSGAGTVPWPRRAHQPPALIGGHPGRLRPRPARPARRRRGRGGGGGDGAGAGRQDRGVPRRALSGWLAGAVPRPGAASTRPPSAPGLGCARAATGWRGRAIASARPPTSRPWTATGVAPASPARTAPARA